MTIQHGKWTAMNGQVVFHVQLDMRALCAVVTVHAEAAPDDKHVVEVALGAMKPSALTLADRVMIDGSMLLRTAARKGESPRVELAGDMRLSQRNSRQTFNVDQVLFWALQLTNQPVLPVPGAPSDAGSAGAIVMYEPRPLPPPSVVANRMRTLSWPVADRTVQFVLLFDAGGNFTQLYVRMQRAGWMMNRFWYAVPANGALQMGDIDPVTKLGTIRMWIGAGSGAYAYALSCAAADGLFQFQGNAMLFSPRFDAGDPLSVGMVADGPANGAAP